MMKELARKYSQGQVDDLDGVTVDTGDWWCNVRKSNTEPLLRLTFEARDQATFDSVKPRLFELLGTPVG